MTKYIALLRGINVSGQKKILMADLKALFQALDFKEVTTYIQSGNVIFSTSKTRGLDIKISEAIKKSYGFDVPVWVKTEQELMGILKNCPFPEEKMTKSYFILLKSEANHETVVEIEKLSTANEEFFITANCVYIFYALGAGKAKLGTNWFERKLKVSATARNYRTMTKLLALATPPKN